MHIRLQWSFAHAPSPKLTRELRWHLHTRLLYISSTLLFFVVFWEWNASSGGQNCSHWLFLFRNMAGQEGRAANWELDIFSANKLLQIQNYRIIDLGPSNSGPLDSGTQDKRHLRLILEHTLNARSAQTQVKMLHQGSSTHQKHRAEVSPLIHPTLCHRGSTHKVDDVEETVALSCFI